MYVASIERWGNQHIAAALIETNTNKSSKLAFGIFELAVETLCTNLAVLELAGRGVVHIALAPFKEEFSALTGLNYLVHGVGQLIIAAIFDNFIVLIAVYRLITLCGDVSPLFSGPTEMYKNMLRHHSYNTI